VGEAVQPLAQRVERRTRREEPRGCVDARDPGRAAAALQGLKRVSVGPMDLLDPASVDAFASRFLATGRPLDILVNSAGIMAAPLARDSRGTNRSSPPTTSATSSSPPGCGRR
jgi:NAD(P)-dependent dehydrogenase (short-subunit alcohol dehydrogenase family)